MQVPLFLFFSSILVVVLALPVRRNTSSTDIQVIAFANVLEQLESAFYTQAIHKFNASNFQGAGFASAQVPIQQITTIANDENTHAITLESAIHALGGQIISNCTFNFTSALTNVETMVATARAVENVGVSAYLGALTAISDPTLVTAAGSILTVEARHQTILNLLSDATSIPQAFDVALTPADVLAIADSFISGCNLGFSANPPLTVANSGPLRAGTKLNFTSPALHGAVPQNQLSCKFVAGGMNATVQPLECCTVPANITGPMYVYITDDQKAMASMNATTNSFAVVAGPALVFVNQPDLLGNIVRPGLNGTSGNGANSTTPLTTSTPPTVSNLPTVTATTSAPGQTPTATSAVAPPETTPAMYPEGPVTTTISPAQASALLSSLEHSTAAPTH